MSGYTTDKAGLAALILSLPYGQLRAVATGLHDLCNAGAPIPTRGVPVDADDFIALLHDWAEAQ
jgi:hypothetical protein